MSVYLDTSLLVAFFATDAHSDRAARLIGASDGLILSDFAAAEFSSALAGLHRMGRLEATHARSAFADFDAWTNQTCRRLETAPQDMMFAEGLMRRLDLSLRTPDALHIAMAHRLGVALATFDVRMAADARRLGVEVFGD